MENLSTKEMLKAFDRRLEALRKETASLMQCVDQIRAATTQELVQATTGLLTPEQREAIRSEVNRALTAPKQRRQVRSWSMETKRRILHEYQAAKALSTMGKRHRGAVKKLLTRHGITSAHLIQWQDQISAAVQPRVS